MTKREYVKRTVAHQSSDRVPFCIKISEKAIALYGDRIFRDFYNRDVQDDLKEGNINLDEAIQLTIGNYMMPGPVRWWYWDTDKTDPSYKNPEAVPEKMPAITRDDTEENFLKSCNHAKWLADKYQTFTASYIYGSHFEKANSIRGIENFLADIAGAPEFAKQLLDFIIAHNLEILPKILKYDFVDAVLLGSDWGTQKDLFMSPETWENFIMPGEKAEYDLIRSSGKHVMIHSCGNILRIMQRLADLGVEILNPVQNECMDLKFLKETYGKKITFWGGVSTQKTLPYGAPEDVRKETESVIRLMSENGGYITCGSQTIQEDVPYENLKAFVETARFYG